MNSILAACLLLLPLGGADLVDGSFLAPRFAAEVEPRLNPPEDEQDFYGRLLAETLAAAGVTISQRQYILLADRSESIQAVMLFWISETGAVYFIGASPVTTGKPGQFEYFATPTGVFDHSTANQDFRAEGTRNKNGIRGYGVKGMRVYDFGWVDAPRGWGDGHLGVMRLQIHSTDPDRLEPLLGTARSKGCVRISASLNTFLDHYGLLDADYERKMLDGRKFSVIPATRNPTPWSGRYLVIVDSQRTVRPPWSPKPGSSRPNTSN